nr:MAG TPA: hypothetical protein [Caudoviricetes sp.]
MKIFSLEDFKKYNANVLQPIKIEASKIIRESFELSETILYGDKSIGLSPLKFKIEFTGTRAGIKKNKANLLSEIEFCNLDLNDGRIYQGRFIEESVDEIYNGFEVIEIEGNCVVLSKNEVVKSLKGSGKVQLTLNDTTSTNFKIKMTGNATNIVLTSNAKIDVKISKLNGTIIVDSMLKTVKDNNDNNAYNLVEMFDFPCSNFKKDITIDVKGTGDFTFEISYFERLL